MSNNYGEWDVREAEEAFDRDMFDWLEWRDWCREQQLDGLRRDDPVREQMLREAA